MGIGVDSSSAASAVPGHRMSIVAPRAGLEPAAYCLGGSRSIRLSYRGRSRPVLHPPAKSDAAGSRTKPSRYQADHGTAARTLGRGTQTSSFRCPDRKVDRVGTAGHGQQPDRSTAVQVRDIMTEATVTES